MECAAAWNGRLGGQLKSPMSPDNFLVPLLIIARKIDLGRRVVASEEVMVMLGSRWRNKKIEISRQRSTGTLNF